MRRIYACMLILFIAILTCGCTQSAPQPAPQPTFMPEPTPVAVATTGIPVQKQINVTVTETTNEVDITYNGGPDAADLLALKIRIDNQDGTNFQRVITEPVVGTMYPFVYRGLANAKTANIVGIYKGGVEQTIIIYYF